MRLLLSLILIGAALWSGYWYVTATALQDSFDSWFNDRRDDGWVAETSDLSVAGFPNRIDTTFTNLSLADPSTGLAWDAPFFQILALSYKPNHVIAVWPNSQRVANPYDTFDITSEDMRASLVVAPSTNLALERSTVTIQGLSVQPAEGQLQGQNDSTDIAQLTMAVETVPGDPAPAYRFGLKADGVSPALPLKIRIDPGNALPDTLEALNADITVTFDTVWDRFAIERARPQPREIDVKLAEARWGQLELLVAGSLRVDEAGLPSGKMTVKARNWREILALGVNTGMVPETLAGTLEDGLGLMAQLSGNPNTLDLPLDFNRGRVFLGPIPLGDAPVLRIR
ncbi:MAG: DUF2125 domain-containing protein [Roseovarius sp.]